MKKKQKRDGGQMRLKRDCVRVSEKDKCCLHKSSNRTILLLKGVELTLCDV